MREIEMKLDMAPEAAEAFMKCHILPGPPGVFQQRSIYFDTPGRHLSRSGFSLRIRQTGDERIQTVKAVGSEAAGLFARPEWERTVESESPVLDDATPIKALLGAKARNIGPVFEVHVERRLWNVTRNGAVIELVLDRGDVVAGERRTPICEIEMELKSGSPSALFSLARDIDAVAPVRLGVLGKAERGHRLLDPAVGAVKAGSVPLSADMDAATAFRRIADACVRQFRLNEVLFERRDSEALHQARVALRRLRSALTIHKPMLEDDRFDHLRDELRWLAGALGDARDIDVLLARRDTGKVRARLERARIEAYDRTAEALDSARTRALMIDLSEWLALGDWLTAPSGKEVREQPARDFAASALDRFRRKVKKGGRNLTALDDADRHEVRKDAKKLRYGAAFFAALFDSKRQKRRHKRFLDALKALQDRLGALNDLATAPGVLARLGLGKGRVASRILETATDKSALIDAAAEAHDAFADAKRFWR